jgi:hypothetical protein
MTMDCRKPHMESATTQIIAGERRQTREIHSRTHPFMG